MFPILLADATAAGSNEAVGAWFNGATAVVGGILVLFQVLTFFATRREVAAIEKRLEEHQDVHAQIWTKLGGQERGLRSEAETKINELRTQVGSMASDLSAVKKEAQIHTDQLAQVNSDIASMPAQIIAQLSNLGVLKRPDSK